MKSLSEVTDEQGVEVSYEEIRMLPGSVFGIEGLKSFEETDVSKSRQLSRYHVDFLVSGLR